MKRFLKSSLSLFLAITIIFSSALVGLGEVDFSGIKFKNPFAVESKAATQNELTFKLNTDGKSYYVSGCEKSAEGKLVIPATYNGLPVTTIGNLSFYNCTSLTSIKISDNITNIGYQAFRNCTSLESITIPKSVISIGDYAFYECKNLSSVYITDVAAWCNIDFIDFYSNPLVYAENLYLNGELVTNLYIPDGVTSIKDYAFAYYESLISVEIPSSVISIGDSSFCGCMYLESITIPKSIISIGDAAFYCCVRLASIKIPDSVTSIGSSAFNNCASLESVTIGNGITSIGAMAFEASGYFCDYSNWESGVLYIGDYLIESKGSLSGKYTIKEGTKTIADEAFNNCKNLESIEIPDSVISIGDYALGYLYENEKVTYFTIFGTKGSAAEKYAKSNGFRFVSTSINKPNLSKISNTSSGVKITWGNVDGADLYRVYRMVSGGEYEYIGSTTSTSYTDKKAPAGKTCRYKIRAKNEAGYSEYSASLAIKHIDEPTLKSIENSAYGVLIKWDKETGAQKYNVYRKVSGGTYEYIGVTSNTYYTDKTAKSGKKYYYAIRGKRDDSVSSQSASLSIVNLDNPVLNTPTSITSGIKLNWSKVTGAEGYYIYRKVVDGDWKKIATVKGGDKIKYLDETPRKGATYQYRVKAYYGKITSVYSNSYKIKCKY